MTTKTTKKTFKLGDLVGVVLGNKTLKATIVEERGNLGPKKERVVRVDVEDEHQHSQFEVPESALVAL